MNLLHLPPRFYIGQLDIMHFNRDLCIQIAHVVENADQFFSGKAFGHYCCGL